MVAFVSLDLNFSVYQPTDWLGKACPELPILWQLEHRMLTQLSRFDALVTLVITIPMLRLQVERSTENEPD